MIHDHHMGKIKIEFFILKSVVKEDTLMDMVTHMDDKTGLVHQMPFTCDRQGFPAILEKVNVLCYLLRFYLSCKLQYGLVPESIIL